MNDQVTKAETAEILRLAEQCLEIEGEFVELGCYRGDTSVLLGKLLAKSSSNSTNCGKPVEKLCKTTASLCKKSPEFVDKMCESSQNLCKKTLNPVDNRCKTSGKRLWIYDSFAGLPEKTREDSSGAGQNFQAGELLVTKREVVDKIRRAGLRNVIIKKAWFDELTDQDLPTEISFAFLDGDLYGSIKTSLKLVAPRLSPQGIMIVHDYNNPELPGSARAVDEFLHQHSEYRMSVHYSLAIISQCKSF